MCSMVYNTLACMQTMLDEMQCRIKEFEWPDRWYFGKERRLLKVPEQASGKSIGIKMYTNTKSIGLCISPIRIQSGVS